MKNSGNLLFKSLVMSFSFSLLGSIVFAGQAEDLKYVHGRTFEGGSRYSDGTRGVLKVTFLEVESQNELAENFLGDGSWEEERGDNTERGAIAYNVDNSGHLIIWFGAPGSKKVEFQTRLERHVTPPEVRLIISIHSEKTKFPAVDEGNIIAYTGKRFLDLRDKGYMKNVSSILPPGTLSAIPDGYFMDLEQVNLRFQ